MIERSRETGVISPSSLLFAVLAGITGVAGSYTLGGYTRRFLVAPIDALVVRLTPGSIVAWMIQNVGEEAHLIHIGMSVAIAVGLLTGTALAGFLVADRLDRPFRGATLAGVLAWAMASIITLEPLLAFGTALPVALFTGVGATSVSRPDHDPSRRRALTSSVGALAFVGLSAVLGRLATGGESQPEAEINEDVARRLDEADEQSLAVAGDIPGLVSPFEEFYNTDIAEFDPDLSAEDWSMTITGAVDRELTVSFEELTDMPTDHRFVTLRCVGENLNGHKLDNAVWTGTPIKPLLEEVDPGGECDCVMLHAEDGYYVQFPVSALENGFLAWEMNGKPLPQSHGRPVRVLIPGHWGEVNVKWLSEIELLDEETDGYWEERGWHGTGPVNTVAKIWSDTTLENGAVEVAGHAYAGVRGIERVEVSTDGGDTWVDAELSEPLPGEDVWRQWRHEFEPDGTHEVVARAVDGEGNRQQKEPRDSYPRGAAGWVRRTVKA
jgi:DMSO/TMAO reductase YedYZ molybdopterin-dependent catalytic subunit